MSSRKADEALRVFAALKDTLKVDDDLSYVNKAVRAASADVLRHPHSGDGRRTLQRQHGAPPFPPPLPSFSLSVEELRKKLEVADGIMRRLHLKNQQLLRRLAALECKEKEGTERRLREKLQQRKKEVRQLRECLQRTEESKKIGGVTAFSPLMELRLKDLEEQYQKLLQVSLDMAMKKDLADQPKPGVQELLEQMQSKIFADTSRHNVELLRLNQRLFDAEQKLVAATRGIGATEL